MDIVFGDYKIFENILILKINWDSSSHDLFLKEIDWHKIDCYCEKQTDYTLYQLKDCNLVRFLVRYKLFFIIQGLSEAKWSNFVDGIPLKEDFKALASSPLHLATFFNLTEDVAWLLEQKFTPHYEIAVRSLVEYSPLFLAAALGHAEVVQQFIRHGVDFNTPVTGAINAGLTPLFIAAAGGHTAVVQELIKHGAEFQTPVQIGENLGYTPLSIAVVNGQTQVVRLLIAQGTDFQTPTREGLNDGCTLQFLATMSGHLETLKLLIEQGADINIPLHFGLNEGLTPLCVAVARGHMPIARLLLTAGAETNFLVTRGKNKGLTPLFIAIIEGQVAIIRLLVSAGVNLQTALFVDEAGNDFGPLHLAAAKGQLEIVKLLIAEGINHQQKLTKGFYQGSTPLHIAALEGKEEVVHYLLEVCKTDLITAFENSSESSFFQRLLYLACDPANESQRRILKLIIEAYPDIRKTNYQGETVFNLSWRMPELQPYLETELEKVIKLLVIDKIDIITPILCGIATSPIKNLKELIQNSLTKICQLYENQKFYIPRYYYEIKAALSRVEATKAVCIELFQPFLLSSETTDQLLILAKNLSNLIGYIEDKLNVQPEEKRRSFSNTPLFFKKVSENPINHL